MAGRSVEEGKKEGGEESSQPHETNVSQSFASLNSVKMHSKSEKVCEACFSAFARQKSFFSGEVFPNFLQKIV